MTTTTYRTITYTYSDGDVLSDGAPTRAAIDRLSSEIEKAIRAEFPSAQIRVNVRRRTSGGGSEVAMEVDSDDPTDYPSDADEALVEHVAGRAWETWSQSLTDADLEQDVDLPHALDLRAEAREALAIGSEIRVDRRPYHANPSIGVETLIIPGAQRAGQVVNGNAEWGEWRADSETIALDDGGTIRLDGSEVE